MLRAIIIDDEEDGREALRLTLQRYSPEVHVLATCTNADEGIRAIRNYEPDLVFLDIQMPGKSGFNLLEEIGEISFEVIFVTSFEKYAIKAIRFSALDYLLKPVDPEELQLALKRAAERINKSEQSFKYQSLLNNVGSQKVLDKLAIPTMEGILFEKISDIIYCMADGNYTKLILKGSRSILVSKHLKEFENMLSESGFFRVHHTYLINLNQIKQYVKGEGGYVIMEEGHSVDVSRRKKDTFMQMIQKL